MPSERRMVVLNDLFNHFIAFLLFPDRRNLPNFLDTFVNGFVFASYSLGSWICVLICLLIALISRFRFQKVFARSSWKSAFALFVGGYVLIFIVQSISFTAKVFTCNSGYLFMGEEGIGYVMIQLMIGMPLALFTVAYLISFICRLIGSFRHKKDGEREDTV